MACGAAQIGKAERYVEIGETDAAENNISQAQHFICLCPIFS